MPNVTDRIAVVRTYLELLERPAASSDISWPNGITLRREAPCSVALARSVYAAVGRIYHWYDRDAWTDERLAAQMADPNVAVWVLRDASRPIGYFELSTGSDSPLGSDSAILAESDPGVESDPSVEIAYFGLIPAAQGKGLGKRLLEAAIRAGFDTPASRVWLHTCTLDHAAALPNYRARGFVPFRTERYEIARPATT
ncbi:MAG TPA: GNAT family N-acetyltransferase [Gemmatimonadaceae bacterium]|nr:GNAT family N-acetyltransferase [Gemmatimonadaceae bacterium]